MIIETLSLTTTPTSLTALLAAKSRRIPKVRWSGRSKEKKFILNIRILETSTETVSASEVKTVDPVLLLNPAQGQPYTSIPVNTASSLLLSASGNVDVGIIINEGE